jgi:hypothetical protein
MLSGGDENSESSIVYREMTKMLLFPLIQETVLTGMSNSSNYWV